jgi:hypothetical protein
VNGPFPNGKKDVTISQLARVRLEWENGNGQSWQARFTLLETNASLPSQSDVVVSTRLLVK